MPVAASVIHKLKVKEKTMNLKYIIIPALLLSSFSTLAADPDYDFSKTDCNSPKVREMLMDAYNDLVQESGDSYRVIDAYDQKKISGGKNTLKCYGTYEFNDGEKANMTYRLYKNSIGQYLNEFTPDE